MRKIFAAALAALAILSLASYSKNIGAAVAQTFNESAPKGDKLITVPQGVIGQSAVGAPVVVVPAQDPAAGGGVINVGQAFGWLAPYINTLIGGLLSIGISWVLYLLQSRLKLHIDQAQRDALQTALTNAASSLIADGAVKLNGVNVNVTSAQLAAAVQQVANTVPGALRYFDITPDAVRDKIIDKIPQVPAGAQMLAGAHLKAAEKDA